LFFRSGLATIILISIAIWVQPIQRVPKALTIAGIVFASTILWCFSLGLSVLRAL
jgi:hypothetical protein